MSKIQLQGFNFSGSYATNNKSWDKKVTLNELLYCAATYGFQSLHSANIYEIIKRISTVLGALERPRFTDRFILSKYYVGSDPTEKAYVSYVLGMAMAKLIATNELGFNWLLHYDLFANTTGIIVSRDLTTKERPDFIAFDKKGNWLVMEAKGRSDNFSYDQLIKGKTQVNTIYTINGKNPLKVVSESFFSFGLQAVYRDPVSDMGISIQADEGKLEEQLKNIRKHFIESLGEVTLIKHGDDVKFVGSQILSGKYFFGVVDDGDDFPSYKRRHLCNNWTVINSELWNNKIEQNTYIGADGFVLIDLEPTSEDSENTFIKEIQINE